MAEFQEQDKNVVRETLENINLAINYGIITGASLAGLTTVASFIAAILAAVVHETEVQFRQDVADQIQIAANHGILTTTNITAVAGEAEADRIAALRAIFTGLDANLSADSAHSFSHQTA